MEKLQISKDVKTKFYTEHKNTFGLLPGPVEKGGTCPGCTTGEGGCCALKKEGGKVTVCYVDHLLRYRKYVRAQLERNTQLLANETETNIRKMFEDMFRRFEDETPEKYRYFRLYYSGDILDKKTARALSKALLKFPKTKFWIYTRSFFSIEYLAKCKNTEVFLSMDPVNKEAGFKIYNKYRRHKNVRLSWMGDNPPDDRIWVKCPAYAEAFIKRIDEEKGEGACARCQLCFAPRKINIRFPIH